MWKTINEVLRKTNRSAAVPLIKHEGMQTKDKEEIVSDFSKHFVNVGRSLAEKIAVKSIDDHVNF